MSYKNLLVHVDGARSCPGRIRAAVELAERFQGSLAGLHVIPNLQYSFMADTSLPAQAIENMLAMAKDEAEEAGRLFDDHTRDSGLSVSYRAVEGDPTECLTRAARYTDLAVLGQHDADDARAPTAGIAEGAALGSGRPVLIVPYIGAPTGIGRQVLVAWNGSREAARAVQDALPFLVEAVRVDVLQVGGRGDELDQIHSLGAYLEAHGVQTVPHHTTADDVEIGELILSRVSDLGSDLLVMGAYGHSRMRELVLGGASRTVLREMTVPVLFSH